MAIGTWVTQNKVRPGVYINYVFSDAELINYASDGVLALPYVLPLSPDENSVIEVTANTMKSKALDKYGVISGSDAYKYITTLLKYSSKLLLFSAGKGGTKAKLTVSSEFTATAKGAGIEGNKFAVEVLALKDKKQTFNTYYNNELVAIQVYDFDSKTMSGENDYVDIVVDGETVTEAVPTVLAGGVDGEIDAKETLTAMFAALSCYELEIVSIPFDEDKYDFSVVEDFINDYNANHVQKVVVVYPKTDDESASKNSEFVIAVAAQTATLANGLVLDPLKLSTYVAAKEAGATYTDDLTFNLCDDIVSINELSNEKVEQNIKMGVLNLSLRSDRSVVIEDDINTLVILSENQSSSLKANDTLRLLNNLSYRIVSFGENTIIGKKKVTETTLNLVKSFVIGIMNEYVEEQAIVNFDPNNDVQVVFGEQPDGILCTIAIQKTQSAKKLYFSIGVR